MEAAAISGSSEPTWDIAHLYPLQGTWSEEDYFCLPCNRLVEYAHGYIEVLPAPTQAHQSIVEYLHRLLMKYVESRSLGRVLIAPIPIRLEPGKYREPDIVFMCVEHAYRRHDQYWETPDLVMEVVSRDNRRHDLEVKRREYAWSGIPEYWTIDAEDRQVDILKLEENRYIPNGSYPKGLASSAMLPGFVVDVDALWDAAKL